MAMPEYHKTAPDINLNYGPIQGTGARAMGCHLYDECLYEAAIKNWDSFNCELCRYEAKGGMEFIEVPSILELEEDPANDILEKEWMDFVIVVRPSMGSGAAH